MQTYRPSLPPPVPQNLPADVRAHLEDLRRWVIRDSQAVQAAANASNDSLKARYLAASPARVYDGDIVFADGTNWNPGSGKGAYRVEVSGSTVTYTFLG
jgi:hypothetical protein